MLKFFFAKSAKIKRRNRVSHSINEPQESVPDDTNNSNKRIVKKRKVVTDIRDIVKGQTRDLQSDLHLKRTSSGLRIKMIMRRTTDNKDSLVQVQRQTAERTRLQPLDVKSKKALKGPTEVKEIKKENTLETGNSIISRLYVANASVFPRNVDINPLSVQPNDSLVDSGSVVNAQKQTGNGYTDVKFDKKEWDLEVLARKTIVMGNNSSHGQDNAVLKGNYPLLVRIKQKSQENGQKWTNTDTGTEEHAKSRKLSNKVTAHDVDKLITVGCILMDNQGRQGEIVRFFANDQNNIICDPKMQQEIDRNISAGQASFGVLLLV
ncbi:hypothetical protein Tco_0151555 [Tanacetum coccineum]